MPSNAICRIGIFYDGTYFTTAQRHFYRERDVGWLAVRRFHELTQDVVREREPGFSFYKIVYAAWFQGLHKPSEPTERQLRFDRNVYYDLMFAGVEPKYLPMGPTGREVGVEVALAVDAVEKGMEDKMDVAVLVSGDGELVPAARSLIQHGVRVMVSYFDYDSTEYPSFISENLLSACTYEMNFSQLEADKDFKTRFWQVFRKPDEAW